MTDQQIQSFVDLINKTDLDQTIKDILIRDLKETGLTDFLREQIKAYCIDEIQKLDEAMQEAKKLLEAEEQNPPGSP